eukprot:SAG22_NODE_186_length_15907_cov_45.496774_3_plen_45_part_00
MSSGSVNLGAKLKHYYMYCYCDAELKVKLLRLYYLAFISKTLHW